MSARQMNIPSALRALLVEAASVFRRRQRAFLLGAVLVLAVAAVVRPNDRAISDAVTRDRSETVMYVARRISAYGDFRASIIIAAALGIAGVAKNVRRWKQAAIASFLAACIAGAAATTIRAFTGRPRPLANVEDGFYGPHFRDHKFQSFPSAHAATSLGTSAALLVAMPGIGAPIFIASVAVPWSRFYMRAHYLTDIWCGGGLGVLFGVAFGLAARRSSNPDSELIIRHLGQQRS